MGYVDENLLPDERVEYRAHLHRIIFLPAMLIAVLALAVIVLAYLREEVRLLVWLGAALMVAAVALFLNAFVKWTSSEFAVTNRRVLVKVGVIRRRTAELLLQKIEGVGVDQTLAGRFLGYGTIMVTGTGGTQETFDKIADPLEFRRRVQHHSAPQVAAAPLVSAGETGGPFCSACGAGNLPGSSYCSRCGKKLATV